jgi:hypothetical protein
MFSRADFIRLAVRLAAIAGRFILSVNDVPETREAFARFAMEDVAGRRRQMERRRGDRRHRAGEEANAGGARSVNALNFSWRLGHRHSWVSPAPPASRSSTLRLVVARWANWAVLPLFASM